MREVRGRRWPWRLGILTEGGDEFILDGREALGGQVLGRQGTLRGMGRDGELERANKRREGKAMGNTDFIFEGSEGFEVDH